MDGIDPRDIRWEQDDPVYRVYFWYRPPAPAGIREDEMGYHSDERRVVGATDVHEVMAWADAEAGADRTYTLYVEHEGGQGRGLIRLAGIDPTAGGVEGGSITVWLPDN